MSTQSGYRYIDISGCDRSLLESVDPELQQEFTSFVAAVAEAGKCHANQWRIFYRIVAIACRVDYDMRWRVSEFDRLLRGAGFPKSGDFATAYAHGFYSVMTYSGKGIYEGGVFV